MFESLVYLSFDEVECKNTDRRNCECGEISSCYVFNNGNIYLKHDIKDFMQDDCYMIGTDHAFQDQNEILKEAVDKRQVEDMAF